MSLVEEAKSKAIALVFDDVDNMRNGPYYLADDLNNRLVHDKGSIVSRIMSLPFTSVHDFEHRPDRYMYIIGCYHNPGQWAGHRYNRTCSISIFDTMSDKLLADVRSGKCMLVFDQVHEGNHATWLWDWFYENSQRYRLPLKNVLYLTADLSAKDAYYKWCKDANIPDDLNIIPDIAIQCYDFAYTNRFSKLPTWSDHINYKIENRSKIKLFNCLNRRISVNRQWLFLRLYQENLLKDGFVSMDFFEPSIRDLGNNACLNQDDIDKACELLPLVIDDADFANNKFLNLNADIYLNSWFTIITETHADNEQQVIISEKTLKPIIAAHPFMVYGSRKAIQYLNDFGFKTWPNLWDESYDFKYDFYRLDTIINNIKTVKQEADLLEWFKRFEDPVLHNQTLAFRLYWENQPAKNQLIDLWLDFLH